MYFIIKKSIKKVLQNCFLKKLLLLKDIKGVLIDDPNLPMISHKYPCFVVVCLRVPYLIGFELKFLKGAFGGIIFVNIYE